MWIFVKPDNIWDISLYSFSFLFLFQIFFSFSIIIPVLTMEIEDNKKGKKKKKRLLCPHWCYFITIPPLPFLAPTILAFLLYLKLSLHQGHYTQLIFSFQNLYFSHASCSVANFSKSSSPSTPLYCFIFIEIHIIKESD